ncbi:polysaccharide lyase family 8 super-sandwich domain-containing protein [Paenibacillus solanacearum]
MFAMKLHDPVYDPTFRAEKSYFFFDNEVIALGSGIRNDDGANATETTLFQSMMNDPAMPIRVQSEQPVTEFPYRFEVTKDEKAWLMDPYGNGYVIPHAGGLRVERKTQSSPDQSGKKTASGAYSTAWIDHGASPKDAGYEYAVLVQAAPGQVKQYAEAPSYEVLRKDSGAHIVKHRKQQALGYVIFDERTNIEGGVVRKTSRPSIIMEQETGSGIVLSVADPDLRLPKLPDQRMDDDVALTAGTMETVRVELRGSWRPAQPLPGGIRIVSQGAMTALEFDCSSGKTMEVALTRAM